MNYAAEPPKAGIGLKQGSDVARLVLEKDHPGPCARVGGSTGSGGREWRDQGGNPEREEDGWPLKIAVVRLEKSGEQIART